MHWDRSGLEAEGFRGFAPFSALPNAGVPVGAGVYVVYRDSDEPPHFLGASSGGHFKGKDPTVPVALLQSAWVSGVRSSTSARRRSVRLAVAGSTSV